MSNNTITGPDAPPALEAPSDRQQWLSEQTERARENRPRLRRPLGTSTAVGAHATTWEERHWTSRALHVIGAVSARSGAGIAAAVVVVAWLIVGFAKAFPSWWATILYSVTGSVTFVMVFVIQHTNDRQTSATQRKLDELIRSSVHADHALIAVEEAGDEHLQALTMLNIADRERATETSPETTGTTVA